MRWDFSKMRGENWKDLWHQPCRAKDLQMASRKRLRRCRTHPTRFRKRFIGCMVASHESTRQRVESSQLQKNHEDHIAGKGFASMSHYNSAHKVLPMPQAMEWKKLETSPAWDLGSVKSKKRGYSGSTKRQKESPLCNIDGHMFTSRMPSWNQNYRSTKGKVVLRGDSAKDDSGAYAVFTEQGSFASWMTGAIIMDVIARLPILCRTSRWCSICLYSCKIGGCSQIAQKFPNRNVQTCGHVVHDMNGPNHGQTLKWYLSNEIFVVIHQQDDCGKDKSKQLYENLDGRKFRAGNVCSFIGNKSNFCQKTWTTKNGWKEAECRSKVEEIDDTSGHWRTHIISWSRVLGMHSAGMQTEWNKYWAVYKAVRITYFCWEQQKITGMGKTSSTNSSVVLRHGRTCSKMRWTILWTGKQESGATVQSFKPLFGWWSVQTRGTRISCRNITSLLTQFLRMLVLGTRPPDILWSVNKLARSVTKWAQAWHVTND